METEFIQITGIMFGTLLTYWFTVNGVMFVIKTAFYAGVED